MKMKVNENVDSLKDNLNKNISRLTFLGRSKKKAWDAKRRFKAI